MKRNTTIILLTGFVAILVAGCGGASSSTNSKGKKVAATKPVTIAQGSGVTNNANSVSATGDVPANAGPVSVHIKSKPYTGQYVLVNWQVQYPSGTTLLDEGNFKVKTSADVIILPNQTEDAWVSASAMAIDAPTTLKVSLTTTKGSTATPPACATATGTEDAACPSKPGKE